MSLTVMRRARVRHGQSRQYRDANLLFCAERRAAASRGIEQIKEAIQKTYGKRGEAVGATEFRCGRCCACTNACASGAQSPNQPRWIGGRTRANGAQPGACHLCSHVTAAMIAGKGDLLPVSAIPIDGTYPSANSAMGKAQPGGRCAGLGQRSVRAMRQMRAGVPACGDPRQGL